VLIGFAKGTYDYTVEIPRNYLENNSLCITIDQAYVPSVEVNGERVYLMVVDYDYLGIGTAEFLLPNLADGDIVTVKSSYGDIVKTYTFEVVTIAPEYYVGDVDQDGELSIADATEIQKYLAKISDLDEEQMFLADFDGDGEVDIADATDIQKRLAKLI
jgi:alpha-amylase